MRNRAIGYVRVSTREQERSGLSLELQTKGIREYCRNNKFDLVEVVCDPGESGKDLDRAGMQRLIARCRVGDLKHVVVYRTDRLTRRAIDLLTLVENVFQKNGVEYHSITEKIDTTTAIGKMYLTIVGAFSQMERDLISERTQEALHQKKLKGEPVGSPPYGYEAGEGVHFEKVPDEIRIIKYIKRLRSGGMTLEAIAKTLNDQGEPTKRGGKWEATTVRKILNNKNYKSLSKRK